MLRAPEPGPREAGAATQGKPLTSFLIQDILRDGVERRGSRAGSLQPPLAPQPTRPLAPRRHPEPEPEGGRGGAGAQEDAPSARPRAAPGKAVPPGETDAGKRARPGRRGRAGWGPAESGRDAPAGCARARASEAQGCGARSSRRRDLAASCGGCGHPPDSPSRRPRLKSKHARRAHRPPTSPSPKWYPDPSAQLPRASSISASPTLPLGSYNN